MGKTKAPLIRTNSVRNISNADFLKLVSEKAPEFGALTAKMSKDVFTEAGYEAVSEIPGGITRFYGVALLVGMQRVDFVSGRNVLDDIGIIERFQMSMGAYMQRNRVKRIHNISPAWLGGDGKGLKNGDSVDPFVVRKPEIVQDYYGLNWNYQNLSTFQRFDLKRGWLTDGGIGDIIAQIYNIIALDRKEEEFALFFHVLSGALNSEDHPLRESQKITLSSWTDAAPTDAEINELIETVKNVAEALTLTPTFDDFNAANAINDAGVEDHVMLVRPGMKSQIEKMLGYAYNRDELQFPFPVRTVANFGGLIPKSKDDDTMQEIYDRFGVVVGYLNGDIEVTGAARQTSDGTWLVPVVIDGHATEIKPQEKPHHYDDPNKDIKCVIAQRGVIFELIQNPIEASVQPNYLGMYENAIFNQPDNGINYNHTRNLVTIRKPGA